MNIYFSGIGGVGIGPLAEIALDAGYQVQGSDAREGQFTHLLREKGIAIDIGQDGSFLKACHEETPLDWFVYTAALPHDHPELITAQQLGIKTAKRDELLAFIIKEKGLKLIAVAGTHGKTTTTGMLIWTFKQLGIPVSYSVGTTITFGPSGCLDPESTYFVYECDEFDRNFLHFTPHLALFTSIDYDHPDTYPTRTDYTSAFQQFIHQSDDIIMWHTDNARIQATADDGWILGDNEVINGLTLPGAHNRRNATLVTKAIEYLKLKTDASTVIAILNHFPGTNRRFEKLADNFYSDYGHHPVEIAATLQLARELSEHVVLIYQPHQNIRQHEIRYQYTDCFNLAEKIYWLPTYLSREDPQLPILTPSELIRTVTNKATVEPAELDDTLWDNIQQALDRGQLVLSMGAGSSDNWMREQLAIKRVANVLIVDNNNNFILQVRDTKPGINNPGMITAFGGSVEVGETTREAAYREIQEETNILTTIDSLTYHKTIFQPLVNDGASRWVTYYLLERIDSSHFEVYEGAGFATIPISDDMNSYNLSSMVKQAIDIYKKGRKQI